MATDLTKVNVLKALAPRPNTPYWMKLEKNRAIGYRKVDQQTAYWLARRRLDDTVERTGSASYEHKALGTATKDLDFTAAKRLAETWFKGRDDGLVGEVPTVAAICKEYVEDRRVEKGEQTAYDAEIRFKRNVYEKPIGAVRLDKITSTTLKKWRAELPGSKSAQDREFRSLKAALNLAVLNRRVSADRAIEWKAVKPYKGADKRRDVYLDLDQRRALIRAATGGVRDLIEAAAMIGARPGELVKLRVRDYDARTKTLTVRKGKTGGRSVPVSDAADALFTRLSKDKLPAAFLLTQDNGEPWVHHAEWAHAIRAAAESAHVPDREEQKAKLPRGVVLYTLRHSWITEALRGGMSTLDVARLTGTSLQMIQSHYGHLVADSARERLAQVVML
jgi:integrase